MSACWRVKTQTALISNFQNSKNEVKITYNPDTIAYTVVSTYNNLVL